MLYIKLDADGNPINHPMQGDNLKQVLEESALDAVTLRKHNYAVFELTPPAANGLTQQTTDYYMDVDGIVRNRVVVREFTQDELTTKFIRSQRDHQLVKCDWTQTVDSPLSAEKKAEWAEYRQALRDLTDLFPAVQSADEVVWPVAPTKA
jgi:hypothetical protein